MQPMQPVDILLQPDESQPLRTIIRVRVRSATNRRHFHSAEIDPGQFGSAAKVVQAIQTAAAACAEKFDDGTDPDEMYRLAKDAAREAFASTLNGGHGLVH